MRLESVGPTIVGEIEIAAPPDAVFDVLTTPEDLEAWWGAEGMYRTHDWQLDVRPGGRWSCNATAATSGASMEVHGVYVEVDRPRTLAYTWNPSWETIPETTVRYRLTPVAGGTLVEVEHTGFEGQPKSQEGHVAGWTRVLGWLEGYCSAKGAAK